MKITGIMNDILSVPQWTLFLDRDGVINKRIVDGYVLHYEELILMPFLKEALHLLKGKFIKLLLFQISNLLEKDFVVTMRWCKFIID